MKSAPIVLLSGWAHGEQALGPLTELGTPGPIVCLSLASSDVGVEAEGVSTYALTVSNHLDRWGEPGWLIGWSTGGVVALETAARYPEKVAGLVLLSATARFCSADGYPSGVKPGLLRAMIRGLMKNPGAVISDFISRALHPLEVGPEVLARRTQEALSEGPASLLRGLQYLAAADLRPDLSSIFLPCLIIHGMKDMIVPWEAGRYLASNLAHSRIELLPSTGHCLMDQCGGARLVRLIAQFWEEL